MGTFDSTGFVGGLHCTACGHVAPNAFDGTTRFVPVEGKPHAFTMEHVDCPAERTTCTGCERALHPATSFLFGSPVGYPFCGVCSRELFRFLRSAVAREVRGYPFYAFVDRPGPDILPRPKKTTRNDARARWAGWRTVA